MSSNEKTPDDVTALTKAILRGGIGELYGIEQKPDESDEDFDSRVNEVSQQRAVDIARTTISNFPPVERAPDESDASLAARVIAAHRSSRAH